MVANEKKPGLTLQGQQDGRASSIARFRALTSPSRNFRFVTQVRDGIWPIR
jgi:hypothetical protein